LFSYHPPFNFYFKEEDNYKSKIKIFPNKLNGLLKKKKLYNSLPSAVYLFINKNGFYHEY